MRVRAALLFLDLWAVARRRTGAAMAMAAIRCCHGRLAAPYVDGYFAGIAKLAWLLAVALNNVGHMHLVQRQRDAAHAAYAEALPLLIQIGEVRVVTEVFVALATAQPLPAITLLAVAKQLLDTAHAALEPTFVTEYERAYAQAQAGPEAWQQAWQRGATMTLDQVTAFALTILREV